MIDPRTPHRIAEEHHAMAEDQRVRMEIAHAKEITRFNWSRFLAGFATGLGLALLVFWLGGCSVVPDAGYHGRDRYGPSPAQDLAESPYGAGFDPNDPR